MDMLQTYKRRDLTIVPLGHNQCLVMACDSCGGVGEKKGDVLYAATEMVGRMAARVVLMEVLASGANVIAVHNMVCCERHKTGQQVIQGIEAELVKANIQVEVLNGSTEENFQTVMTAVGVTAIGIADTNKLRFMSAAKGDRIIAIGTPLVGDEIFGQALPDYSDIKQLLLDIQVKEIVPVGSKGILYEANLLATLNQLSFDPSPCGLDLEKSAGPATCLVAVVTPDFILPTPCYRVIGRLV